jgi:D-alanyl-D-alanine dipeptidase
MKTNIYGNLHKAFLQPDVAEKLLKAQLFLKELHPAYNLIIYDAARPRKFQKALWDSLKVPASQKGRFVSNPKNGSLHNFGAAVDLSIVDERNNPLDMGCAFDTNDEIAYPSAEARLLSAGRLTQQQVDNRKLLRTVMYKAGFYNIQTEWWHFNSCTREAAWAKYKIIE